MPLPKEPFLRNYRLVISTLSPIHIGCGEDYEPTHYVVKENSLYPLLDLAATGAFANHEGRQKLERAVAGKDSLVNLQKLYGQETDLPFTADRYVPMTNAAAARHKNWITGKGQCVIERTIYDPISQNPILPGTSIKGAIRTAILNHLIKTKNVHEFKNAKELEKKILGGSFDTDPLRLLKIGDAHLADARTCEPTRIMTRHGRHWKDGSTITVKDPSQNLVECISPFMVRSFVARMTVQHGWPYDIADICNGFYGGIVFKKQIDMLEAMKTPEWTDLAQEIRHSMAAKSGFLLRVGKHDGAEFLTIEKYRKIKTKHGDKLPISTTVCGMESGGYAPFAWLFVEVVQEGEEPAANPLISTLHKLGSDISAKSKIRQQQFAEQKSESVKRHQATEVKRQTEAEQRRVEDEKRKIEEEKRLAEKKKLEDELASMTPNRRQIEELQKTIRDTPLPQPISGQLWQDVGKLVKEAATWLPEDKAELARVCRDELPAKLKSVDKKRLQALQDTLLT
ncbi:MAG: type III-A CRISPR-associated RAMP protein Csm5 [Magnetococcales bacterium]|nr:type III-A CRISPR-associated RAMP protein Csm5 [Magnetococcales bacterium]